MSTATGHMTADDLAPFLDGTRDATAEPHLAGCELCRQRLGAAQTLKLDVDRLRQALERADHRRKQPPVPPSADLRRGFSRRMEQILRLAPLLRMAATDGRRQMAHVGRLEVSVLALRSVLNRMESGEGGATRDQLHQEVGDAIAWFEAASGFLPSSSPLRRTYVDEILDELTNATSQGRAFSEPFRAYHLDDPALVRAEFRLLVYRETDGELKYQLTDQGLDLIYRLHEVDEFLTVEVELLLLLKQIERGQFERALGSLDRLATACSIQRRRMDALAARIRRDVLAVRQEEMDRNDSEVREQLKQEKELFSKVRRALEVQAEKVADLFTAPSERNRRQDQVGRIRRGLLSTFQVHQEMASQSLQLRRVYIAALERSAALRTRYGVMKLEPEVLEPLLALPPRDGRDQRIAQLLLPPRRPRLFSPWQVPFARRRDAQEQLSPDAFPVDLDDAAVAPAGLAGYSLHEQAVVHAALLTALVATGGRSTLAQLTLLPPLAGQVEEHALLVGIHALFLHNAQTVRLGDAGDPFTPLHRLARVASPHVPARVTLRTEALTDRCVLGPYRLTDLLFTLHDATPGG